MKITIPKPCQEDWGAMEAASDGRHCHACDYTVPDLTDVPDAELVQRAQAGLMPKCARFRASQLNRLLVATAAAGLAEGALARSTVEPSTPSAVEELFSRLDVDHFVYGDIIIPERTLLGFVNMQGSHCPDALPPPTGLAPSGSTAAAIAPAQGLPAPLPPDPSPPSSPALAPAVLRLRREED